MSTTRYLEFDSTYRNRIQYPEPAEFVVEMSQTGIKDKNTALDPMSLASPILWWNSSLRDSIPADQISFAVLTTDETTSPTILISAGAVTPITKENFYVGAILQLTIDGVDYRRRIVGYKFNDSGGDEAQITVDSAFPDPLVNATGKIENPTNDTSTATVPQVFIPCGKSIDNFYVGYTIQQYNSTCTAVENQAVITAYDGTTHLATLDRNTSISWNSSDLNFALRKVIPTAPASISTLSNPVGLNGRAIQLDLTTSSSSSDTYVNSFLRMIQTASGGAPTTDFSNPEAPFGEERRIVKYIAGSGTVGIGTFTTTVFQLDPSTSSSIDGYYVGGLITVNNTATREVISYNGSNRTVTVSSAFGVAPATGNTWVMRTAILETPFTISPSVGGAEYYEIENFTRDNYTPFVFTGSLVSTQEMVCYEVELMNLILPNSFLKSGRGGRPIFHPYMYVELQQVSASSAGNRNLLCSNNPNSARMIFRAILDDTSPQGVTPFIKIDSDGMTHTMKFKPTDALKFALYQQGGALFKTVESDTTGGTEPNPLVQISAVFSFKRV